jgi:ferredoxin
VNEPSAPAPTLDDAAVIDLDGLAGVINALVDDGFEVIGPTVRDNAVVLDRIEGVADLPAGWGDEQDGAHYRLRRRADEAVFGFTTPATSWKPFLHPSREVLFRARRDGGGFEVDDTPEPAPRYAFLGVRSCDLAGIGVQDRVLRSGNVPDPGYAARRDGVFIVVAQCGEAGGTCFCASMATGPTSEAGFDLAITELVDGGGHRFVVQTGSERGAGILGRVPIRPADETDRGATRRAWERAEREQTRRLPAAEVADLLGRNLEHPRWDDVASRCLACTNCTMVCPTCFCGTVEDTTDITGTVAERSRTWDSCFTLDFTHLVGGPVRASVRARYRQWLTHKLSTWFDQFGESGCVGCGRCIAWCPVAIDLTEEVAAIQRSDGAVRS